MSVPFTDEVPGPNSRAVDVRATCDAHHSQVVLEVSNPTGQELIVSIFDRYTLKTIMFVIDPGESESRRWSVHRNDGWYDLTVTVEGNPTFATQLAGHLGNGKNSVSDPSMGDLV